MNRSTFIKTVFTGTSSLFIPMRFNAQTKKRDQIKGSVVKEFVAVAHSNLETVKELISEYPLLLNAAWDWGGGDFETAIGAAGHMGLQESDSFFDTKGGSI